MHTRPFLCCFRAVLSYLVILFDPILFFLFVKTKTKTKKKRLQASLTYNHLVKRMVPKKQNGRTVIES